MTDKESDIYSTGYWNGIAKVKPRELTDGEIDEVAQENFEGVGRLIYMIQSDVSVKDFKEAIRSFAKAILKKAS